MTYKEKERFYRWLFNNLPKEKPDLRTILLDQRRNEKRKSASRGHN